MAAYANHNGRDVSVIGRVVAVGIRNSEQVVARLQPGGFYPQLTATSEQVANPYMYIGQPEAPTGDLVLCYFHTDAMEKLSRATQGTLVTVVGRFHGYAPLPAGVQVILVGCDIEEESAGRLLPGL